MARLRILLADDHTIVRQGLVSILKAVPDFEVVAEAADGSEAVDKALATRPEVVVLDVTMPRLNGLEAARRIHKALPESRILVLTMHEDEEYVLKMVRAGASGYLVKDGAAAELVTAIRALGAGQGYFGPQAAKGPGRGGLPGEEAGRGGSLLPADRPRARGLSARRGGLHQRPGGRRPLHQLQDGGQPPHPPHGEARPAQLSRASPLRRQARAPVLAGPGRK